MQMEILNNVLYDSIYVWQTNLNDKPVRVFQMIIFANAVRVNSIES